jgi:hypothetical protein
MTYKRKYKFRECGEGKLQFDQDFLLRKKFIPNLPSAALRAKAKKDNKLSRMCPGSKFVLSVPWSAHLYSPIGGVIDGVSSIAPHFGINHNFNIIFHLVVGPNFVEIYMGKPYTIRHVLSNFC